MLREECRGGEELRDFAFGVLRGEIDPTPAQLYAHGWISDRAFGKAIQSIELQTHVVKEEGQQKRRLPVDKLNKEQLEKWNELLAIMADAKAEEDEGGPMQAAPTARMLPAPDEKIVDEERDLDAGENE